MANAGDGLISFNQHEVVSLQTYPGALKERPSFVERDLRSLKKRPSIVEREAFDR